MSRRRYGSMWRVPGWVHGKVDTSLETSGIEVEACPGEGQLHQG